MGEDYDPFENSLVFNEDDDPFENWNLEIHTDAMEFRALKSLSIVYFRSFTPGIRSLMKHSLRGLTTLLQSIRGDVGDLDTSLDLLKNEELPFQRSLTKIRLDTYIVEERALEQILLDILQSFSTLREIILLGTSTKSFSRTLAMRTEQLNFEVPENQPEELHLCELDVEGTGNHNDEMECLRSILRAFTGLFVHYHSFSWYAEDASIKREIDYFNMINLAGRKYIEREGIRGASLPAIQTALWPNILERACNKVDMSLRIYEAATGNYYLLRNGSILQDIIARNIENEDATDDHYLNEEGRKRNLEERSTVRMFPLHLEA